MDASQFRNNALNKIERIKNEVHPLAVISTHGTMLVVRIFENGLDVNGYQYEYNSETPVWISDTASPIGSQNEGKTGRAKRTSYFDSYRDYKDTLGRGKGGAFINFRVTNELQFDFLSTIRGTGGGRVISGVKNQFNFDKIEGLEEMLETKIFIPNKEEKANIRRLINEGAAKIWNE